MAGSMGIWLRFGVVASYHSALLTLRHLGFSVDECAKTGLLGANSLVGECVISRLSKDGRHIVFAFSRRPPDGKRNWE